MTYKANTDEDYRHNVSVELAVVNCGCCGGSYAINEKFRSRCYEHGTGWTCPYCKTGWGYYGNHSKAAKLQKKLEQARRQELEAKARASKLSNQVGEVSKRYQRVRERVRNGVCPCCNRTFQSLLKHMRSKHPEYGQPGTLRAIRDAYGLTQAALADEVQVSAPYISRFENGKPLPEWVERALDEWLEANA